MHEIETVAVWFSSVIAGMILTMLTLQIVSAPRRSGRNHDDYELVPARRVLHKPVQTRMH